MLYAEKRNKVLRIDETAKDRYIKMGFDIYKDGDGKGGKRKLVAHGAGKKVPISEYEKLADEVVKLKALVNELGGDPEAEPKKAPAKEMAKNK